MGLEQNRVVVVTGASRGAGKGIALALGETAIGGDGPPYYPMARAIIGGLIFATFFTLLLLPTWYLAMEDWGHWGRRALRRARGMPLNPAGTSFAARD